MARSRVDSSLSLLSEATNNSHQQEGGSRRVSPTNGGRSPHWSTSGGLSPTRWRTKASTDSGFNHQVSFNREAISDYGINGESEQEFQLENIHNPFEKQITFDTASWCSDSDLENDDRNPYYSAYQPEEATCRNRMKAILNQKEVDGYFSIIVQNAIVSMIFISTAVSIIETVPEIEEDYSFLFSTMEKCFTFFFTLEILLRFWTSDDSRQFFCSVWNVIDMTSTLPWYAEQALAGYAQHLQWRGLTGGTEATSAASHQGNAFVSLRMVRVVRMVRLLRIMRIVKFGRHFEVLSAVFGGIRASRHELLVMIMFTNMSTLFAATAVFYLECEEIDTKFTSIPASIWWALPTVTGVGYGDVVPQTAGGKIAAAMTMMGGTLITTVSGALITSSFIEEYHYSVRQRKLKTPGTAPPGMTAINPAIELPSADLETRFRSVQTEVDELLAEIEGLAPRPRRPGQQKQSLFGSPEDAEDEISDMDIHKEHLNILRDQSKAWFRHLHHVSNAAGAFSLAEELTAEHSAEKRTSIRLEPGASLLEEGATGSGSKRPNLRHARTAMWGSEASLLEEGATGRGSKRQSLRHSQSHESLSSVASLSEEAATGSGSNRINPTPSLGSEASSSEDRGTRSDSKRSAQPLSTAVFRATRSETVEATKKSFKNAFSPAESVLVAL